MPKDNLDDTIDEIGDMDADSSAAPALDESTEAPKAEAAAPADSSAATDETETDTLSIVRDVVDPSKEAPAEAASSAEGEDGEGADGTTTASEQDNEDYSDVPFNKHPRFQHLLKEAKAHKADAVRYQNVERFLEANNLDGKEAADVMEIAGLAKTDPPEAWKRIKPWVQQLLVASGEVLPQDLAERVARKELTQDGALEISRSRAALASRDAKAQFEQQRGQRQQEAEVGRVLVDTAEQWVNNRRIRDPNFAAKEDRLMERIAFLQRAEGRPNTADGVRAQLKKAYDFVNKQFAPPPKPAPAANQQPVRRPAIRPVTSSQVASHAQPAAPSGSRSTLSIIQERLGKKSA